MLFYLFTRPSPPRLPVVYYFNIIYSVLNAFTGFTDAAFSNCKLTISKHYRNITRLLNIFLPAIFR